MYNQIAKRIRWDPIAGVNYKTYEGVQTYKETMGYERLPDAALMAIELMRAENKL